MIITGDAGGGKAGIASFCDSRRVIVGMLFLTGDDDDHVP